MAPRRPRRELRDAASGLTTRGRSFLAAGIACAAAAVLFGQRDLLRVGILLLALPVACLWAVLRTRYRLACLRRVTPARVAASAPAQVTLELDNVSRLPTGLLLVEDRLPPALGSRPRFMLGKLEPRGRRTVGYDVCSPTRGQFLIGPLSIRLTDPFGMCELQRSFAARDTLTVTPRVTDLPHVPLGGDWAGNGDGRARSLSTAGEDDAATREYRYGDPLHRVHWRSTARYGELMVRREEQPWQSRGTVVLDTRARAHRGDGPESSFEWAVSAAASLGLHLARNGFAVRLVTDEGASVSSSPHEADGVGGNFSAALLDALAVLSPGPSRDLQGLRAALRGQGNEGLLVAVLGALDLEQAAELARLRRGNGAAVAVLLDVGTWEASQGRPATPRTRSSRRSEEQSLASSARLLSGAGWRVLRAGAGTDLAQLWPQAAVSARQSSDEASLAGAGAAS